MQFETLKILPEKSDHDKNDGATSSLLTEVDEGSKHISANYFNKSFASIARSMSEKSKPLMHENRQPQLQNVSSAPPVVLPPHAFLSPPNQSPTRSRGENKLSFLALVTFYRVFPTKLFEKLFGSDTFFTIERTE